MPVNFTGKRYRAKPRRKAVVPPKYRLHCPSGLAVITIDGKDHYLGKHGSVESPQRYANLIAGLRINASGSDGPPPRRTLLVGELTLLYLQLSQVYYVKQGRPTAPQQRFKNAMTALNRVHAAESLTEFGPLKLTALQRALAESPDERIEDKAKQRPLSRRYVNCLIACIVRMFKWAASEELVLSSVYRDLTAVEGLKAGRSTARETERVQPVSEDVVAATLRDLPANVAAMVLVQPLTGARPGEILSRRAGEIQRSLRGPWTDLPGSHKTEHHGTTRTIFLGPQAQAVLTSWLDGLSYADHVFAATRKQTTNLPGKPFDKDTYRQLIQRVCQQHSIPDWKQNQLRHSRATRIREQFGLETAQVVLGHTKADTTEIYAEWNHQLAAKVQLAIG